MPQRFVINILYLLIFCLTLSLINSDERESSTIMDDEYLKKSKELSWLLFIVLQSIKNIKFLLKFY